MLGKTLSIFLIILFPIILISNSFVSLSVNEKFYDQELEKLDIYDKVSKENVDIIKTEVLSYLKEGTEIQTDLLKEKEKQHMQDVKEIYKKVKSLSYTLILILIVGLILLLIIGEYKKIPSVFLAGSILTVVINLIAYMLSQVAFTQLFTLIHKLIYTNNLWILNPETDNLIKVFSEQFFIDFTIRMIIISSAIAFAFLIIFYIVRRIMDKFSHEEHADY